MAKHRLHRRYAFKGRRKGYGSAGDKLVWESRAYSWYGGHRIEEVTCDAAWFYSTMTEAAHAELAPA